MVEDANVHQCERFLQPLGDRHIRTTRFGDPRRVVVKQHDGCGIQLQCVLDENSRVDGGPVNGPLEQFPTLEDAVLTIEIETAERFGSTFS